MTKQQEMTTVLTSFTIISNNVSEKKIASALSILQKTNALLLPEKMTIKLINAAGCDWEPDGTPVLGRYYPTSMKHVCEAHTAYVYTKGLSLEKIQEVLAHELGHAEHFHLHPESASWESPRQEAYAYTVSQLLTTGNDTENRFGDITIEDGYLLRK